LGLYVKTKRLAYPPITFTDAALYKAQGALMLLEPFREGLAGEAEVGIYVFHPGYRGSDYRPVEVKTPPSLLLLEKVVREGLVSAYAGGGASMGA